MHCWPSVANFKLKKLKLSTKTYVTPVYHHYGLPVGPAHGNWFDAPLSFGGYEVDNQASHSLCISKVDDQALKVSRSDIGSTTSPFRIVWASWPTPLWSRHTRSESVMRLIDPADSPNGASSCLSIGKHIISAIHNVRYTQVYAKGPCYTQTLASH
ncbi:hypothetical protein OG21DRAFT_1484974 [Imleria badia]|nr:hypothetical protein OG21DRAFT_1484974 [Imleria badia]